MSSRESVNMAGIVCRCTNPNHKDFEFYGGRNIKVYPLWVTNRQAFIDYLKTLDHYGEEGYSLDRIDNNKGYEPGNLRFTTAKTQARNRSNNIYAHYYGQRMLLIDIAGLTGIAYDTLKQRYHKGWDDEKLIQPVKKRLPKSDLIVVENNQALTTSLIIAETFKKRHDIVLRAIENSLTILRDNGRKIALSKIEQSFIKGEYKDAQGKPRPMYYLNRDAFSLIVMGFTGTKALEWKLKYIDAFNRMEAALKGKVTAPKKKPPKTKKEESVQLCLNFDEPEPEEKLTLREKISTLKFLVEQSPDDVKIKYLEQIAELI